MTDPGHSTERLGALEIDEPLARVRSLVPRIWDRDHTVWQDDPREVADRLGWLDLPDDFGAHVDALQTFANGVRTDGLTHALLVGMGGSSLYPEVQARLFGDDADGLELHVLDSTDPAAVRRAHRQLPMDRTLLIAASKSGTTAETRAHLAYFWDVLTDLRGVEAGRQAVAITDAGSDLDELGRVRSFLQVFENPRDIGGRYSALSYFGLVPGALLGVDVGGQLASARAMAQAARSPDLDRNGPARLGAILAAAHAAGRDKLTLLLPDPVRAFGDWVEQLVAESTGKHGVGILPVVGEPVGPPEVYGDDRLFVSWGATTGLDALVDAGHPVVELPYDGPDGLGGEVLRWEFATAVAGALLDINPFDQPNVAAAKQATGRVLDEGLPTVEEVDADTLLDQVRPGDYVAITAFVDPGAPVVAALEETRVRLRDRLHVPVTLGIGPRYLHSTGQLHKGGPPSGVFLQVVGDDEDDVSIPGKRYGFSTLKHAQAAGDLEALQDAGLRVGRVPLAQLTGR